MCWCKCFVKQFYVPKDLHCRPYALIGMGRLDDEGSSLILNYVIFACFLLFLPLKLHFHIQLHLYSGKIFILIMTEDLLKHCMLYPLLLVQIKNKISRTFTCKKRNTWLLLMWCIMSHKRCSLIGSWGRSLSSSLSLSFSLITWNNRNKSAI